MVPPSIAAAPTAEYVGRLGCIGEPSMLVAPRESRKHLQAGGRERGRVLKLDVRVRRCHVQRIAPT